MSRGKNSSEDTLSPPSAIRVRRLDINPTQIFFARLGTRDSPHETMSALPPNLVPYEKRPLPLFLQLDESGKISLSEASTCIDLTNI